jgi:protocatechuate 3,4-dioxygenase beta subunit
VTARGVTRRRFLGSLAAAAVAAACGDGGSGSVGSGPTASSRARSGTAGSLPPTPACGDEPTPDQTEGPFFESGTPERSSLREPGIAGTPLVVEGAVVTTACMPIGNARMEFWQADDRGEYDNAGYRLRGHLFTDGAGAFRVETIVPGLYTGRTRHIHVKVQPPGGDTLTTQLYFPGEPGNEDDGIFDARLLMTMGEDPRGTRLGAFTFALDVA